MLTPPSMSPLDSKYDEFLREKSPITKTNASPRFNSNPEVKFNDLKWWKKIIVLTKNFFISLGSTIQETYHSLVNRLKKIDPNQPKYEKISRAALSTEVLPSPSNASKTDTLNHATTKPIEVTPLTSPSVLTTRPIEVLPPSPASATTKDTLTIETAKPAEVLPIPSASASTTLSEAGGIAAHPPTPAIREEVGAYLARDAIQRGYDYIYDRPFLQKFVEQNPEDPFLKEINRLAGNERFSYQIQNMDYEKIEQPDRAALELQAAKYAKKYQDYGINIKIAHVDQLNAVIEQLQKETPEPGYVGIIIGGNERIEGHVLPLLCYFGPKDESPRKAEFLIMDVLGMATLAHRVNNHLIEADINEEQILKYSGLPRQADEHSCRTGALSVLCNALLSLKHYRHENGFKNALRECFQEYTPGHPVLTKMPADWVAHEQIFKGEKAEQPHIRDVVSKNPAKRTRPRAIKDVRKGHKEDVRMRYTLSPKDGVETLRGKTPPPGVVVDFEKNTITYETTVQIDTYLVRKARRRKNELTS